MPDTFTITLAQFNPTVGDLKGNAAKARAAHAEGLAAGSDLVVLPEMFITGYQTQDLVSKPAFHRAAMAEIEQLARECADGPAIGIGGPLFEEGHLYNAYFILQGGEVRSVVKKHERPNTHVFDEVRLFVRGPISGPVRIGPVRVGIAICEDAWHVEVCETLAETGAEILIVPNGSPYYRDKLERRVNQMVSRVVETGLPLIYLNMVGGQDDQVFDGGSFVLNPGGKLAVQMPVFDEVTMQVNFTQTPEGWRAGEGDKADTPDVWEQDYRVMVQGLRDYMSKTGFERVLLGLSGGIDSALVATIAADALGPEAVRCVMLPSEYTSQHSLEDAKAMAGALGCRLDTLSIDESRAAVESTLAPIFEGREADVTEENIQSRLRGLLLMALSNKFGEMLLTTGNKSEVAVGYATIYGDMSGGYNPIKDLYKTRVFETCNWRNENHRSWMKAAAGVVIPQRIISKPPSAELKPDQRDEDSLPPYEVLDGILELLIDKDASVAECVKAGYEPEIVKKIERLIYLSEYKRFQSAPGPRLSGKAFWLDRRYPIVNRWREES